MTRVLYGAREQEMSSYEGNGWELQWPGQDAVSRSAHSWTLQLVRLLQVNSWVIIGNNADWRINISI